MDLETKKAMEHAARMVLKTPGLVQKLASATTEVMLGMGVVAPEGVASMVHEQAELLQNVIEKIAAGTYVEERDLDELANAVNRRLMKTEIEKLPEEKT